MEADMKRYALLFLLLLIPACANNPEQVVYQAKLGYATAQTQAIQYARLPVCNTNGPVICRTTQATETIAKADQVAVTVLNNAETAVRNPTATDGTTIEKAALAAQSAVKAFLDVVNVYYGGK
jgi:hypothetical protein